MKQQDEKNISLQASRPDMPEYGLLDAGQGRGLLPWEWAQERLEKSHNYWVATTRPDSRPHATAVWGIWWQNAFWFSTGRLTRKARNLAGNPGCVVCTESATEAVIVEGVAELVANASVLKQLARRYRAKYAMSFPADGNIYAVRPAVAFGFIDSEEFAGSATRWSFAAKRKEG